MPNFADLDAQVPQHDTEAEKAVLGAVLVENQQWMQVANLLSVEDFWRSAHGVIWASMGRLMAAGTPVDLITLKADLESRGDLDRVGNLSYITSLASGTSKSVNAPHYAKIVRDCSLMRNATEVLKKSLEQCWSGDPANDIVSVAIADLKECLSHDDNGDIDVGPASVAFVNSFDESSEGRVIPTGYADLDRVLSGGGMTSKELVILAARPSVGKTSLAMGIARRAAARSYPAVVFSLEMSRDSILTRLISNEAAIPISKLVSRALAQEEYARLSKALDSLNRVPLSIIDNAKSMTDISAWAHRLKAREQGLRLVIVDYLQLIRPTQRSHNREAEVREISSSLKDLGKELDCCVIALSQLSRAPEGRKDKRPQLSDLRESGALEQDADLALLLYRSDEEGSEGVSGVTEVFIAKQRNGETGVQRLLFAKEFSWFRDLIL